MAGVLAIQLGGEDEGADISRDPVVKPQPEGPDQETESYSGFVMPPPETLSEVSERPLFLRSRRPVSPEAEITEEVPIETSPAIFVLSGIVLTDTQRLALLQGQTSSKVARVEEGEEYEGWTLESIHPNKVVMRRGQEVSEIALEDGPKGRQPQDTRRTRQRIQAKPPPRNEKSGNDDNKDDKKMDDKTEN